jgi:hypothetical protein
LVSVQFRREVNWKLFVWLFNFWFWRQVRFFSWRLCTYLLAVVRVFVAIIWIVDKLIHLAFLRVHVHVQTIWWEDCEQYKYIRDGVSREKYETKKALQANISSTLFSYLVALSFFFLCVLFYFFPRYSSQDWRDWSSFRFLLSRGILRYIYWVRKIRMIYNITIAEGFDSTFVCSARGSEILLHTISNYRNQNKTFWFWISLISGRNSKFQHRCQTYCEKDDFWTDCSSTETFWHET